MKIIAFGDIHERTENLDSLRDEIASADLVVITGDMTQFGGVKEASAVIDAVRALNPNLLAQAGNLDAPAVEDYLRGLGISLHGTGHRIGEVGIFGCGGCPPSPFGTPNELSEAEIAAILRQGYEEIKDAPVRIMVPHSPPFDAKADIIRSGLHVGSKAVREFIEAFQPDLCLCGHIHEAAGEDQIGRTKVINPGPFYEGGHISIAIGKTGIVTELKKVP